jgi:hypothetical protein
VEVPDSKIGLYEHGRPAVISEAVGETMRIVSITLSGVLVVCAVAAASLATEQLSPTETKSCCEVVRNALQDFQRVKVGMTRKDVEKYFVQDGGMNFRGRTFYVYRKCDYIKLTVSFTPDPSVDPGFSPNDTITELSRLIIDYPTRD